MRLKVVGTAAALLAGPGVSLALGLGDIQLKSTLNAPLNAEIELIATPEELASLRTQIASRDAFSRYGLDYPSFLSGIQVRPVRLPDGRNVIQLTSTSPITEPFATLLVEASWARGRNLREYTVLFDPPVFAPQAAPAAPVAAATTGGGERSGTINRPVQPAPEVAAPAPVAPAGATDGTYNVRGGDSLSAIARNQYGTGQTDRAMIAIYRANPQAFDGNINQLRAGAVLRLPDQAGLAAVDPGEAATEVRRQTAAWGGAARSSSSSESRLRLVPPGSTGSGGNSAETQQLRDRVTQLESELAESRRLLELRNAELARLQSSARAPAPAATPPAPTTPAPAPAEPPAAVTPPAAEPAAPAVAEPPAPQPEAAPAPAEPEGSSLLDTLKAFWFVPVGLLALIAAVLGLRAARRRRQDSMDSLSPFAVGGAASVADRDTSSDTFPLRKPVLERDNPSIVVEESGTHERPSFAKKDTRTVDLDEGTASMVVPALDATAALEQGDPLAEADFHMAYGLYDQAADLVKLAIQREPGRRDLKLKLLEVFFVWGNKDQFLQTARDLADTRDQSAPGEWEKVVIMGKQLAPEDALFSQSYSGAGPASVDLNLEGGQNLIDFDLHGEPAVSLTPDGGVDMDLSASTQSTATPPTLDAALDFMLDDPARGDDPARTATTRQMVQPGFDGEEASTQRMAVEPTVEQPALEDNRTVISKLDAHSQFGSPDQTAELALDDLGLDLGKLESTNDVMLDDSRLTQALASPDAPTLVAGLDETSRRLIEDATTPDQPTELLPLAELAGDSGATSRVASLDFELDGDAETGKRAALNETDFNLDLDVGSAEQPVDGEYQRTQRIEPAPDLNADATEVDLEPVTMSEVGTKLDLARAYMDMGDPDGARSILNEVLTEGSASQKQEAQRLIDSIPG
jgi:pilus assembly protein FimV